MATYYITDSAAGSNGALSETQPGDAATSTSWKVAKLSSGSARQVYNSQVTSFGTNQPDGAPNGSDSWVVGPLSGTFASGNWEAYLEVYASIGSAHDGLAYFRLWYADDTSGTNAVEIPTASGRVAGSGVTNLSGTPQTSSATTIGAPQIDITDKYIFLQVAWQASGSSGNNNGNVIIRTSNSRIVTPTFTPAAVTAEKTSTASGLVAATGVKTATASSLVAATVEPGGGAAGIAYDTTANPGSAPKTATLSATAWSSPLQLGTFSTADAAFFVAILTSTTGVSEPIAPASLAWVGGTPGGATTWTKQGESTWVTTGTNLGSVAIWTASCSAALSSVNIEASRASGTDSSSAILALYALTGVGGVGTSDSGTHNANTSIDVRSSLTGVASGSWLFWGGANGNTPATALTGYTGPPSTTIDAHQEGDGVAALAVGHIADVSGGAVTVGASATDVWSLTAAIEIQAGSSAGGASFDGIVAAGVSGTATLDALVDPPGSTLQTATVDSLIQGTVESTATVDVYIAPRLRVDSSGRYLLLDGDPFRYHCQSIWFMGVNLTQTQRRDFFADCQNRGINGVIVMALVHEGYYTAQGWAPDAPRIRNDAALGTYQNQHPWSTAGDEGDFSKLNATANGFNSTYWTNLDNLIDDAADYGIVVTIPYHYSGYGRYLWDNAACQGWHDEICNASCTRQNSSAENVYDNNTQTAMYNYGAWLATRWKDKWNIIWMTDGDSTPGSAEGQARYAACRSGIRSVLPGALFSSETDSAVVSESGSQPEGTSTPSDYSTYDDDLDLETFYGYENASSGYLSSSPHRAYAQAVADHVPRPAYVTEARYAYDLSGSITEEQARRSLWTAVVGGGTAGHSFGSYPAWTAYWTGWDSSLWSRYGVLQSCFLNNLMLSIDWWLLKPATVDTYLTAGNGFAEIITSGARSGLTRIVGAATTSGLAAVVYVPSIGDSSQATFSVDMTFMSDTCTARWLNPRSGSYSDIGTYANTGTQSFTTPGSNGTAGEDAGTTNDWVLLLTIPSEHTGTVSSLVAAAASATVTTSGLVAVAVSPTSTADAAIGAELPVMASLDAAVAGAAAATASSGAIVAAAASALSTLDAMVALAASGSAGASALIASASSKTSALAAVIAVTGFQVTTASSLVAGPVAPSATLDALVDAPPPGIRTSTVSSLIGTGIGPGTSAGTVVGSEAAAGASIDTIVAQLLAASATLDALLDVAPPIASVDVAIAAEVARTAVLDALVSTGINVRAGRAQAVPLSAAPHRVVIGVAADMLSISLYAKRGKA